MSTHTSSTDPFWARLISATLVMGIGCHQLIKFVFFSQPPPVFECVAAFFIVDTGLFFLLASLIPKLGAILTKGVVRWTSVIPAVISTFYLMDSTDNAMLGLILILPLMVLGHTRLNPGPVL